MGSNQNLDSVFSGDDFPAVAASSSQPIALVAWEDNLAASDIRCMPPANIVFADQFQSGDLTLWTSSTGF